MKSECLLIHLLENVWDTHPFCWSIARSGCPVAVKSRFCIRGKPEPSDGYRCWDSVMLNGV